MITLSSKIDDFEFGALHGDPQGPRRGGIIVLQEIFGIDAFIRKDVERWASLGFEVLAPSLFDRQERGFVAEHGEQGFATGIKYAQGNGIENAMSDIQACIDRLKPHGPVNLVGYCYGGAMAWFAAVQTEGLSAVSSYYGRGVADAAGLQPRCPVICHYGAKDPFIPAETDAETIRAARPDVPVYVYPNSGHGFNNEGPDADPAEVRLARQRTLDIFKTAPVA